MKEVKEDGLNRSLIQKDLSQRADRICSAALRFYWTVRGSNTCGVEIFRTCPDRPCGSRSILYNGYRVLPGGKERSGRDADPSPHSSAVVMKG